MADDIEFGVGFKANIASIAELRRTLESQLSKVGISVEPHVTGKLGAFAAGAGAKLSPFSGDIQQRALTAFENKLKSAQDAVSQQANVAAISAGKVSELSARMDELSGRAGFSASAFVNLKTEIAKAEAVYARETILLGKLESELRDATGALIGFKRILGTLPTPTVGGSPIGSIRGASNQLGIPDFKLSEPDLKSIDESIAEFDKLHNVIKGANGKLFKLNQALDPEELSADLRGQRELIKNSVIEGKRALQQETRFNRENKDAAASKATAQNELAQRFIQSAQSEATNSILAGKSLKDVLKQFDTLGSAFSSTGLASAIKPAREAIINTFGQALPGFAKTLVDTQVALKNAAGNNAFSLKDIPNAVSDFKQVAKDRFGLTGPTLDNATEQFRSKLTSGIEKRVGEELSLSQRQGDVLRRILSIREEQEKKEKALVDAINRRLRDENVRTTGGKQAQLGGAGGLRDLQASVKTSDQEKLSRIIEAQGETIKKTTANFRSHNGNIAQTSNIIKGLTKDYTEGAKAAFQFGFAARDAATRLLAWSIPAAFIFNAIGSLKQATRELINLDTLSRRLAFFQPDGGNTAAADSFNNIATATQDLRQKATANITAIVNQARSLGVALNDVSQAALTVQKVGQQAFSGGEATSFLNTVLALKRIEGAELDVARGAEILNATLQQLGHDGIEQTTLIAAKFVDAANRTAFSVDQLATVVNGVLPAFKAVQGAGFDEVLVLAEVASKRLGTNASRVRTALRQLPTLAVKFADEIQRASGINIINENGTIKGTRAILETLKVIKDLKGTVAGFKLGDALAEQENIADALNLAEAYDELNKRFNELAKGIDVVKNKAALEKFFAVADVQAESLDASTNRLNASLVSLVQSSGVTTFFKNAAESTSKLIDGITILSNGVTAANGPFRLLATTLAGLALSKVAASAASFSRGFLKGAVGAQLSEESKQNLTKLSKKEGATENLIVGAVKERIISEKEGAIFLNQQKAISTDISNLEKRRIGIERELNVLDKSGVTNKTLQNKLETELAITKGKVVALTAEEKILQEGVATAANKALIGQNKQLNSANTRANLKAGLATAATTAALVFGPTLAKGIGGSLGDAVEGALISGVTVGSAAALAGPIVGLAAGLAAALIGGTIAWFQATDQAAEELTKKLTRQAEIRNSINAAIASARKASDEEIARIEKQDKLLIAQAQTKAEIAQLEIRLGAETEKQVERESTSREIANAQERLRKIGEALGRREAQSAERRLAAETAIANIKAQQVRSSSALNLLQEAQIALLKESGGNEIALENVSIEFNKQQVNNEIKNLLQQLAKVKTDIEFESNQSGADETVKKLRSQQHEIETSIEEARAKGVKNELNARTKILELATSEAHKQIDAWKEASRSVRESFKDIFEHSLASIRDVGEQLALEVDAIQWKDFGREVSAEINTGLDEKFKDINRGGQKVSAAQEIGAATIAANDSRLDELKGLSTPLNNISTEVANAVNEFVKASVPAKQGISPQEQVADNMRRDAAKLQLDDAKSLIGQNKQILDERKKIEQQNIGILKEEIDLRVQQIKNLKQLLAAEAERARALIKDPGAAIGQLKNINFIKPLFKGLSDNAEEATKQLKDRLAKIGSAPGGGAVLRRVLEGVEAADSQNVKLTKAFNTQFLKELIPVLATNPREGVGVVAAIEKNKIAVVDKVEQGRIQNEKIIKLVEAQNVIMAGEIALINAEKKVAEETLKVNSERLSAAINSMNANNVAVNELATSIKDTIGLPLANLLTENAYIITNNQIIGELKNISRAIQGQPLEEIKPIAQRDELTNLFQNRPAPALPQVAKQPLPNDTIAAKAAADNIAQQANNSKEMSNAVAGLKSSANDLKQAAQAQKDATNQSSKTEMDMGPLKIAQESLDALKDTIITGFASMNLAEGASAAADAIRNALLTPIKLDASNAEININARMQQELSASQELHAILLELAQGKTEHYNRLVEIVKALLSWKITKEPASATADELDFSTSETSRTGFQGSIRRR